jgi:hypothetical protein
MLCLCVVDFRCFLRLAKYKNVRQNFLMAHKATDTFQTLLFLERFAVEII